MQVGRANEMGARLAARQQTAGAGAAFAEKLNSAMGGKGSAALEATRQEAREAAEQLVATTLVQPLLQQMRNDPFKSDLMHGGMAEDAFGAQLDTQLADRIVRRANWPLVERIVDTVMGRLQGATRLEVQG
jgi:hypothetical protein